MYWIGKPGQMYGMKLNANCSKDEKNGEGPGSCGGKVTGEKNSNSKDIIEPIFKSSAHIKEEIRPTGTTYYKIIDSKGNLVGGVPNNKNQAEKDLNRIIRKEERLHAKSNIPETKTESNAKSKTQPKTETSNSIIKVKNLSNYNFYNTNDGKNAALYNIKQKNIIIADTVKNISKEDIENILEKIPSRMIKNIRNIEITDDKRSDNPNTLGIHVPGSETITIYKLALTPKKLENTLYHEIGHQFDNDKGYNSYASRGDGYKSAVKNDKSGFISIYAKNQPIPEKQYREDFADSVREYLKDEVKFEKNYPNRTKFIRDKLNSIKQNSIVDNYQFYQKLNYNCPDSEKSGEGKGSCGGVEGKGGDTKSSTGNLSYDKFLSSIESSETPIVMSYDQFKAKSGLTFLGDDHGMLRMPHGISKAEQNRKEKRMTEWSKNEDQAKADYDMLLQKGKIEKPKELSRTERLIQAANGHPDNESTKAAQRLLEKKGIDWKKSSSVKLNSSYLLKPIIEKIKAEKASGHVSKESAHELKTVMEQIKGAQKLNMSFPGFTTSKDLDLQLESILKSIEPDVMKAIKKLNLNKNIKQ